MAAVAASTIAVATAQHTRTAPTEEELQRVPPKPDAMPGEFGTCPRCKQMKARWEVTRNGRPWYRCHRFPTCLVALNLARIAASYPHLDANLAAPKKPQKTTVVGFPVGGLTFGPSNDFQMLLAASF